MGIFVKYPGFRWLWSGQLLSQLGNAVFYILGLWEIQLKSPFLLSIAGLAITVPAMLGLFGGVLVDRLDARRVMLITDLMRGAAVLLGLFALTIPGSLVWVVIVLLAINALGVAFFGPAESVVVPHIVQEVDLTQANGLYSLTSQLSSAVGSALGGAAVAAIGVSVVFSLDMASFWISALAIWLMMRTVTRPGRQMDASTERQPKTAFFTSFKEGLSAFGSLPVLSRLLPFIILINFAFMAAFVMLPAWVHIHLHGTALWYGIIDAAWALGVVVGSVLSGRFGRMPLKSSLTLAFLIQSLLLLAFGFVPWPAVSAGVLLVAGIFNGVGNALSFTWMQRLIPVEMRGRVFGLIMTLFSLANPLGSLAAGLFWHVLPEVWAWVLGGVSGVLFCVFLWRVPGALEDARPTPLTSTGMD
ncbi:MFS transporter [Sulfobacillus harzensis]|uniref:MFS transporter n=1 Tax=Sulfobacillus harzensis TaxID=2729629 RepID=A0A7Y0L690_9FIRM|nr:MFS transporter [Sulfobacillus harzensis]NMP24089.1 MFS transporter [Sulfobacillus harzensis]